jgi:hypothetical protein
MAAAKAPKKGTKRKREDEEDKNAVVVLPATSSIKQLRDGIKAQRQISAVETSRVWPNIGSLIVLDDG